MTTRRALLTYIVFSSTAVADDSKVVAALNSFVHMQVIEIAPSGNIVFSQGQIGVARTSFYELNVPYDAKVVGDYTGLA